MESFLEKMQKRYTVKKYNPKGNLDPKTIKELEEIVRLSPSSINSQPWKFVFVTDQTTKEKLAPYSQHNAHKVADCSLVVVFQVMKSVEDFEQHLLKNLPEGANIYFNNHMKPLPEEKIKSWMKCQVYLALGVLLSACAEMDLDSTPMEGIEPELYDKILGSTNYETLFAVAIGEKDPEDANQIQFKPKSRLSAESVIEEI